MLVIQVGVTEVFDETTSEFIRTGGYRLELEHSLASLSKWESEFEKPFLGKTDKTSDEMMAYVQAMVLTENPPGDFLEKLSTDNIEEINAYINKKMTATWFHVDPGGPPSTGIITAELIYYWMTQMQIPFIPCETWHLNRLFTLIRVSEIKQAKPKRMSRDQILARNRELNARRKAEMGTKG